jgi:soluble lytic murein transglycosylase-like protein
VDIRSRYASQIQAAAMANNVDAALIHAVIEVESGYKRYSAASRKKATQTRVSRTYMVNPA